MKIFFDHQTFTLQERGGISRYFHETMRLLRERHHLDIRLGAKYSNNMYLLSENIFNVRPFMRNSSLKGKRMFMRNINRQYSRRILKRGDFDIFHPTYYDPYFLEDLDGRPYVITVHDLIYHIYGSSLPDSKAMLSRMRESIGHASKIIAISNNTKMDLIRFLGIDESKINVVYHGASQLTPLPRSSFELPERYLLFVGDRKGYKNFTGFITAAAEVLARHPEMKIVCAGGERFTGDDVALLERTGIRDRVLHFTNINDEMLASLYTYALAFIFPSKYEGFGIPILEAFSCGCPIALSSRSSFPEIAQDAGCYFDPDEQHDMSEKIERLVTDKDYREHLVRRGYERLKEFSWERCSDRTREVYAGLQP